MLSTTGSLPSHPTGTNRGHCNIVAQYQIYNAVLNFIIKPCCLMQDVLSSVHNNK